ncbi:MAG: tryptophan transporter [Bacillota bacterium]
MRNRSLSELILVALLLAIGYVVHQLTPGFIGGMKPDLLLSMLFISLLMFPNIRLGLVAGVVAGILSAIATTFPGGQIPNIIDKVVTTLVVLALIQVLGKINDKIQAVIIGLVGTVVSGAVFLGSALILFGLPAPFKALFMTVVLPAAAINAVTVGILYPIVVQSRRLVAPREAGGHSA